MKKERRWDYHLIGGNDPESIFIPFNTPSLKNSKVKTARGIFSSKTVKSYLSKLGIQTYSTSKKTVKGYVKRENQFEKLRDLFIRLSNDKGVPILIGFHFVRDSKRAYDFNNATQIIQDLLVAHDFIEDDDIHNMYPIPLMYEGRFHTIDKENPGVYLKFY